MSAGCAAHVDSEGLSRCGICGALFDPFMTHLEVMHPEDPNETLVVCGACVPDMIEFSEAEGPPGFADLVREVWFT